MNKHTINDGLRMMGQLLLHRRTTGVLARNQRGVSVDCLSTRASCFCLAGAVMVVAERLGLPTHYLTTRAAHAFDQPTHLIVNNWDHIGEDRRAQWAATLARITEP